MRANCYPFKVGSIDCAALLDDASVLGVDRFLKRFPDGTEAAYRRAYAEIGLSLDEADNSFNVLLARVGGETVLVDAGEGGKPYGGYLIPSLRLAGMAPEAITLVVITHSHGDHVLGLLGQDNQPVFPNATYVISRPEIAFWRQRTTGEAADHRPILEMIEARGLRVIDMDDPIVPGLTAVPLPGHTPGQIGILLESDGERLLHLADLLHSPMQFAHLDWSPRFDVDTIASVPTRRVALGRAADEGMLGLLYHLTFPGLGRVKRAGNGFVWEPLIASR
jgi:glyoxylase-like metal-dependent hydrolase (beta-lactamase superfamily II)